LSAFSPGASRLIERHTSPAAAGQPPTHFDRYPPGRGQLAVFPRCSRLTYQFRYARRSHLEIQPADPAAAGRKPRYLWDRTLVTASNKKFKLRQMPKNRHRPEQLLP
jgi:hypothetical protein